MGRQRSRKTDGKRRVGKGRIGKEKGNRRNAKEIKF